jgi:hypothetical protein
VTTSRLLSFPDPVDEVSARLVAFGAVLLATATLVLGQRWLVVPLAYGFVARMLAGPRFSPLGLLVTKAVRPRLAVAPRPVPGPPKRFAQGIGAAITVTAAVLALGVGAGGAANVLIGMLVVAASLEAFLGFCLGCRIFALLMRMGVIPPEVCERCNDLWGTNRADLGTS